MARILVSGLINLEPILKATPSGFGEVSKINRLLSADQLEQLFANR
jgi:hypothetical protein